jgi:hypothetical protein
VRHAVWGPRGSWLSPLARSLHCPSVMLTQLQIKKIGKALYSPKSRKFHVVARATFTMENYWDGGTRVYCKAIDLETGRTAEPADGSTIPWSSIAHASFPIPQGVGILTHNIFCGQDCGVTLYVIPGCALAEDPGLGARREALASI